MALTDYDKQNLSSQQQEAVQAATDRWNDAHARGDTEAMNAAHAEAEAIRSGAGYSGGSDGTQVSRNSDNSGGGSSGGSSWSGGTFSGSVKQSGTYTAEQQAIIDKMNANSTQWWMASTQAEQQALHAQNQQLAAQLEAMGVSTGYNSAAGTWNVDGQEVKQIVQNGYVRAATGASTTPTISPLTNRAPDLQSTLDKWLAAAQEQAKLQADYAVQKGVNDLQRAEEDAKEQFQTQRNQVSAAEAKALDNQALYNERRGDRGGIGAAQYDSIMNTAAQNQLAVNQAQVKLSTDTARQIADLRAQGEFQKADALLQLSQTYLQQLISIQQWSAEFNLSVDQFNKQIEQWNNEFELKVADLLGEYRGQQTLASRSLDLQIQAQNFDEDYKTASLTGIFRGQPTTETQQNLAEAGYALAAAGIEPSESQKAAMEAVLGIAASQVSSLVTAGKLAQQTGIKSTSQAPAATKKTKVTSSDDTIKVAKAQYENGNSEAAYTTIVSAYDPSVVNSALALVFDSDEIAEYSNREVTSFETDEDVVLAAKAYFEEHPTVAWNSRTVDNYLSMTTMTSAQRMLFKSYLQAYGNDAGYSR